MVCCVSSEASTLTSMRLTHGRAVAALSSGSFVASPVLAGDIGVAVVTDGLVVLCFDANLQLIWCRVAVPPC